MIPRQLDASSPQSLGLAVCGEAENGRSGVRKFRELKPDLALLDLAMRDIDGLEAGRQMSAINPSVLLILFTLLNPWGLRVPLE
jgi:YesN/AraC family two-component response regulator